MSGTSDLPVHPSGPPRRTARVTLAVPLRIFRPPRTGEDAIEETATISVNCHGCRYFSQFPIQKNEKLLLQVSAGPDQWAPEKYTARVAWVRKSQRLAGMYQVAVEFDTPRNIWDVAHPPADWKRFGRPADADSEVTVDEIHALLVFADEVSHYRLLGISPVASQAETKSRFYNLARRYHPDRHMDRPEWTPLLLRLMDALTVAYKTLSDDELKQRYDQRQLRMDSFKDGGRLSDPDRLARECLEQARECLSAKNFIGSILWLRRAIEARPESSKYRALLATSLAAVPEYRREAVEQFEKAIVLDPANLTAHLQYAQLLEKMKLPGRARSQYMRVLELDTSHRQARERIKELEAAGPRPKSASSLLSRLTGRR